MCIGKVSHTLTVGVFDLILSLFPAEFLSSWHQDQCCTIIDNITIDLYILFYILLIFIYIYLFINRSLYTVNIAIELLLIYPLAFWHWFVDWFLIDHSNDWLTYLLIMVDPSTERWSYGKPQVMIKAKAAPLQLFVKITLDCCGAYSWLFYFCFICLAVSSSGQFLMSFTECVKCIVSVLVAYFPVGGFASR